MPFAFRALLFAVFWKSGVALGAALCIAQVLKNRSADLRRLVFSTTIVAMFAAAAVAPALPRWTAVTPLWFHSHRALPPAVAGRSPASPTAGDTAAVAAPASARVQLQTSSRRIDLETWLVPLIWLAGSAMLLARFAVSLAGLYRVGKASNAVTDPGTLAHAVRFGRRVRMLENDAIGAPVTWGIVRSVILVPAGFAELPPESRDAVIRHELAHIQAHDFLMRGLTEIARALIWFQPLMWTVRRQLREEQELACDNRVLAEGGKPSAYAKLLMEWHARRGMDSGIAVGIAHQSCLTRRLYALLDPDLRRDTVARAGVASALFLALAGAFPLAAISFTEATPASPAQQAQSHAGQSTAEPAARPRFDVVSIKPCKPGGASGFPDESSAPGRLRIDCDVLADANSTGLIQAAYNRYASGRLTSTRVIPIEGGPDWIHSEKYEIDARADGNPSISMMEGPMMQAILEDRFKLTLHREIRLGAVYELTVGKGSPKLTPVPEGSCIPLVLGAPLPVLTEGQQLCRNVVSLRGSVDIAGGTLSMLADSLARILGRPVIDKTGITGKFEMHLAFTPENFAATQPGMAGPDAPPAAPVNPGLFQAIQEQLGLRLVPAKGPVDVLVIDHIERPSAN